MNWQKAKTILIVYFIIINIALLSYLIYSNSRAERSKMQVAQQVTQLLDNNNISIDKKLLTETNYSSEMKNVYVYNVIKNYESFAEQVLGEECFREKENCFKNDNAYIYFEGDGFEIRANNLPLSKGEITKKNALKYAKEYLSTIGIEIKEAKTEISDISDGFGVVFSEYIGGFEIFGTKVTVEMKHDGIYGVYGNWYNHKSRDNSKIGVKDTAGVMIEYMNLKEDMRIPEKISDIRLGYSVFESENFHESVLLTPVWKITNETGKIEYIDARETD